MIEKETYKHFAQLRAKEIVRQSKASFDQERDQVMRWFKVRLLMAYTTIGLLFAFLVTCCIVIFLHNQFSTFVVNTACVTFFGDFAALVFAAWKMVLSPNSAPRLKPTISDWGVTDSIVQE